MVALYRPGPMDNINEYIARKHGKKPVSYVHPKMKEFLDTTYGVLVYQDDLLMTAIEVAGYSWGEVDKFRKAVGKKIPAEMAKQHIIFVEGCVKHGGMKKEEAEKLWDLFEPFQGYGFNKAHAASYGRVAYQTAYMKANFPEIYMSAVLSAESGDVEKIGEIVAECKRMGIPVLPPDVNESFSQFTVVKSEDGSYRIRFGLVTIKNFGQGISTSIIEERKKNGRFKSLADFLDRIKDRNLNKKSLEALIKSGALDEFGERGSMLSNLELILGYNKEQAGGSGNQDSLFGLMGDATSIPQLRLLEAPPATAQEKLSWEKELLGLYISGHPLDRFREKLEKRDVNIAKIKEKSKQGQEIVIGGLIDELREVTTKNNERMLFLKISDLTGSIETVVFPRTLSTYREILKPDACIALSGKVSKRNGEISLIAEKVKTI
jgi:DNA polymerase-3 subunit alpha